ncbi:AMP-binding protein [Arthrobacter sp. H16F315]|uniref:AMP-binding protein n=1 Tax=Arthrobacter sp. H16F315 TaxID=2955314 RepID=UPI00315838D6
MFSSPFPDVEIPDVSLYEYLFGGLEEVDLERIALVDGVSGAEMSYRSLVAQIDAVAGAVAAQGLGVHGVAAILCPNVPAFAVVFHGLLRAGATVTTVNSLYTADEIALQLADAGAEWLFTVSALLPAAREAAARAGIPAERLVVLDGAPDIPRCRICSAPARRLRKSPSIPPPTWPLCRTPPALPAGPRA